MVKEDSKPGANAPTQAARATQTASGSTGDSPAAAIDIWQFDAASGQLTAPNGQRRRLPHTERLVLSALAQAAPEPACYDKLARALGLDPATFNKHRLEVIVHRLRSGVRGAMGADLPLRSVRGVGYVLAQTRLQ